MRIAVIADTHDNLPSSLRAAIVGADEIWHLGDICSERTLREVCGIGPPVHAIRGNRDPLRIAPETLLLIRLGHVFYLVHEPPFLVPSAAGFALHGHTHVPRDEMIGSVRHLNPGTVGKPNHGFPPSFAWLHIEKDAPPLWEIVPLD